LIPLPVTRLYHFCDCIDGQAYPGMINRGHCFVPVGVKRPALIGDRLNPFSLQKLQCGLMCQLDTLAQAAPIAWLDGQRPLQVIDQGQKAAQQAVMLGHNRILGQALLSLAVIVHFCLQAERSVMPVFCFGLPGLLTLLVRLDPRPGLGRRLRRPCLGISV